MQALAIFSVAFVLLTWQPRKLGVGWSALGGTGFALVTTRSIRDIQRTVKTALFEEQQVAFMYGPLEQA